MCWAIWYYLYNLKNVKYTDGGVQRFLSSTNGTKSRKVIHVFHILFKKIRFNYEILFVFLKGSI